MAATASVTITGSVAGGPSGSKTMSIPVISSATSTDALGVVALSSGFNSVTVPSNTTGVVIVPPAGNTQTITLKGVTGDTGIPLHVTNATLLTLPSSSTTLGVTVGGAITCELFWF